MTKLPPKGTFKPETVTLPQLLKLYDKCWDTAFELEAEFEGLKSDYETRLAELNKKLTEKEQSCKFLDNWSQEMSAANDHLKALLVPYLISDVEDGL